MPVGYMGGTKRARMIPSLVSSNQCGGPKKAGTVSRYHTPRDNWRGGRTVQKTLFSLWGPNCSKIPLRLQTMRPANAGGIGRF